MELKNSSSILEMETEDYIQKNRVIESLFPERSLSSSLRDLVIVGGVILAGGFVLLGYRKKIRDECL